MAKYTVNHSCGHDQTHELFGPHKQRDSKREWLETTLCTDCWKKDKREQENADGPQFCLQLIYPFDPSIDVHRLDQEIELQKLRIQDLEEWVRVFGPTAHSYDSGYRHASDLSKMKRDLEQTESYRKDAAKKLPKPGTIQIIGHAGTFPVKDQLKARGYRFGEVLVPTRITNLLSAMTAAPTRGWTLSLGEKDSEKLAAELKWIEEQGWNVAMPGPSGGLGELVSCLIAGDSRRTPQQAALSDAKFISERDALLVSITNHQHRMDAHNARQQEETLARAKLKTFVPARVQEAVESVEVDPNKSFEVWSADGRKLIGSRWMLKTLVLPSGEEIKLPICDEADEVLRKALELLK